MKEKKSKFLKCNNQYIVYICESVKQRSSCTNLRDGRLDSTFITVVQKMSSRNGTFTSDNEYAMAIEYEYDFSFKSVMLAKR